MSIIKFYLIVFHNKPFFWLSSHLWLVTFWELFFVFCVWPITIYMFYSLANINGKWANVKEKNNFHHHRATPFKIEIPSTVFLPSCISSCFCFWFFFFFFFLLILIFFRFVSLFLFLSFFFFCTKLRYTRNRWTIIVDNKL